MKRPTVLALPLAAVLLAGCSGSGSDAVPVPGSSGEPTGSAASPTTPGSSSSPPPAGVPSSPATATVTVTSAAPRACATSDLVVGAGRVDAGAGQRFVPIVFRNRGTAPCALRGYPGIAALDAAAAEVAQARREPGLPVTRVVLAPGAVASAVVHAGAVPTGNATCPPDWTGLLVTPPDQTVPVRVAVTLPACDGLTVRPVVAGSAGQ